METLRVAVERSVDWPRLLGAVVPDNWPDPMLGEVLPLFLKMTNEDVRLADWLIWSWISRMTVLPEKTLIGAGGFKNVPDSNGKVEIGCGVLAQFQGRGFASEGIAGMVSHAFTLPAITAVYADTDRSNSGARRALEKCGFVHIGPGEEPGTIRYEIHSGRA